MSSLADISASTNPATATFNDKKATTAGSKITNDFNDFLKLLTTQLQNQDPTAPTDTNEFTNQIIGFSEVEQTINTNSKLDKLVEAQTASATGAQLSSASTFVGKMVEVEGDAFAVRDGEEPEFSYELPEGVSNSYITIYAEDGGVVGTFQGKGVAGKHNIVWDAKDINGERVEPGKYTLSVSALDKEGKPLDVTTYVTGEVTGAEIKDGVVSLRIEDEYTVPVNDVQSLANKKIAA